MTARNQVVFDSTSHSPPRAAEKWIAGAIATCAVAVGAVLWYYDPPDDQILFGVLIVVTVTTVSGLFFGRRRRDRAGDDDRKLIITPEEIVSIRGHVTARLAWSQIDEWALTDRDGELAGPDNERTVLLVRPLPGERPVIQRPAGIRSWLADPDATDPRQWRDGWCMGELWVLNADYAAVEALMDRYAPGNRLT